MGENMQYIVGHLIFFYRGNHYYPFKISGQDSKKNHNVNSCGSEVDGFYSKYVWWYLRKDNGQKSCDNTRAFRQISIALIQRVPHLT